MIAVLLLALWAAAAPPDTLPVLSLLPLAGPQSASGDEGVLTSASAGLRLGASRAGRFQVWTEEEAARAHPSAPLRACFEPACLAAAGRTSGAAYVLAAELSRRDSLVVLKLALWDAGAGKVKAALRVQGRAGPADLIPFAASAAERLLAAGTLFPGAIITGESAEPRAWKEIPWLNPRDTVDRRRTWGLAGSGLLLAGMGMAWAQGQLLQEDGNSASPGGPLLSGEGARSFLRGFFAAPDQGAQYAALGGAGIAYVDNALAPLINPAGVAESTRDNVLAAKRTLPGGTPSLFLGYAGPLRGKWSQGLAAQYQGDGLASETSLLGALAYDWSGWGRAWEGVRTGAALKVYLAKVGEEGVGLDCSTGHSFGMGLDLGLQARLSERITGALSVRDVAGFLRHVNTFTNQSYAEVLPPEYRVGALYRASADLALVLDGQKGMYADQVDHVRLGAEQIAFGFLALRAGLHQVFGREAVRKLSAGFGIDTEGFEGKGPLKTCLALNYAYEFGLDEDEPLGGGQQFSLELSF